MPVIFNQRPHLFLIRFRDERIHNQFWPGQRHIPSEWSSDLLLWIVEWHPSCIPRLKKARRTDRPAPDDSSEPFCRCLNPSALQRLAGLLESVAALSRPDAFNRGLDFALFALWDEFQTAAPVPSCDTFHPKLERVLGLLSDPDEPLSLSELARKAQLSPTYLSALFQRQTGLTIPAYRNRLRLQAFLALAHAHPEVTLLTHALDAGFGSYAQFYRVFTEAMGMPPRQWQRRE